MNRNGQIGIIAAVAALGWLTSGLARAAEGGSGVPEIGIGGPSEGYYSVQRDARRCPWPRCGGYFVKKVNASKTRCADGTLQPSCYVVDVTRSDEIADSSVVRGALRAESFGTFGLFGLLEVKEIWTPAPAALAAAPIAPAAQFYQVHDTGIRCIRWPCFTLSAALLNTPVALTLGGLTGKQLQAANAALARGEKIVVRGALQRPGHGPVLHILELYLQQLSPEEGRLCAEYTTADGRFYARNFTAAQQAEAEEWIRLDPEVQSAGYGAGTCLEANHKPCPLTDPPVCGIPVVTDVASDYESLCEFRKVIRAAAGTEGESKGRFTEGLCP